jgi:hypothetical protein
MHRRKSAAKRQEIKLQTAISKKTIKNKKRGVGRNNI